jgi:hypothetical protein
VASGMLRAPIIKKTCSSDVGLGLTLRWNLEGRGKDRACRRGSRKEVPCISRYISATANRVAGGCATVAIPTHRRRGEGCIWDDEMLLAPAALLACSLATVGIRSRCPTCGSFGSKRAALLMSQWADFCCPDQPLMACTCPAVPDAYGSYTALLLLKGEWDLWDLFQPLTKQQIMNEDKELVTPLQGVATDSTFM